MKEHFFEKADDTKEGEDIASLKGSKFFGSVVKEKQFTILGTTDHRNVGIETELAKEENIKAMAEAGVKHWFLEIPRDAQAAMNAFYGDGVLHHNGEDVRITEDWLLSGFQTNYWIPEDKREEYAKAMLDMVKLAKGHGIKLYCADMYPKVAKENPDMIDIFEKMRQSGKRPSEFLDTLAPETRQKFESFADKLLEERNQHNAEIAKFVKDAAENEKAVVTFGFGHSDGVNDLDELLGQENTRTVALYASKKDYDATTGTPAGMFEPDPADFAYYVEEGEAVELSRGWAGVLEGFRQRFRPPTPQ